MTFLIITLVGIVTVEGCEFTDALSQCYQCEDVKGGVGFESENCPEICPDHTFVNEDR